jgi:hypothetical protein
MRRSLTLPLGERVDGGVPTAGDDLGKRFATYGCAIDLWGLASEEALDEVTGARMDLGLGERPELDSADPASERLGDPRCCEDVGGAGQQKTPRCRVLVDALLDRVEQVRNALDLVDQYRPAQAGDEAVWIEAGGLAGRLIVECDARGGVLACHDLLGEGALADLPRTQDEHDSAVAERIDDERMRAARDQQRGSSYTKENLCICGD